MNMSYTRFRNTLIDLEDCRDYLEEQEYETKNIVSDLSTEEMLALRNLIQMAREIVDGIDSDELEAA